MKKPLVRKFSFILLLSSLLLPPLPVRAMMEMLEEVEESSEKTSEDYRIEEYQEAVEHAMKSGSNQSIPSFGTITPITEKTNEGVLGEERNSSDLLKFLDQETEMAVEERSLLPEMSEEELLRSYSHWDLNYRKYTRIQFLPRSESDQFDEALKEKLEQFTYQSFQTIAAIQEHLNELAFKKGVRAIGDSLSSSSTDVGNKSVTPGFVSSSMSLYIPLLRALLAEATLKTSFETEKSSFSKNLGFFSELQNEKEILGKKISGVKKFLKEVKILQAKEGSFERENLKIIFELGKLLLLSKDIGKETKENGIKVIQKLIYFAHVELNELKAQYKGISSSLDLLKKEEKSKEKEPATPVKKEKTKNSPNNPTHKGNAGKKQLPKNIPSVKAVPKKEGKIEPVWEVDVSPISDFKEADSSFEGNFKYEMPLRDFVKELEEKLLEEGLIPRDIDVTNFHWARNLMNNSFETYNQKAGEYLVKLFNREPYNILAGVGVVEQIRKGAFDYRTQKNDQEEMARFKKIIKYLINKEYNTQLIQDGLLRRSVNGDNKVSEFPEFPQGILLTSNVNVEEVDKPIDSSKKTLLSSDNQKEGADEKSKDNLPKKNNKKSKKKTGQSLTPTVSLDEKEKKVVEEELKEAVTKDVKSDYKSRDLAAEDVEHKKEAEENGFVYADTDSYKEYSKKLSDAAREILKTAPEWIDLVGNSSGMLTDLINNPNEVLDLRKIPSDQKNQYLVNFKDKIKELTDQNFNNELLKRSIESLYNERLEQALQEALSKKIEEQEKARKHGEELLASLEEGNLKKSSPSRSGKTKKEEPLPFTEREVEEIRKRVDSEPSSLKKETGVSNTSSVELSGKEINSHQQLPEQSPSLEGEFLFPNTDSDPKKIEEEVRNGYVPRDFMSDFPEQYEEEARKYGLEVINNLAKSSIVLLSVKEQVQKGTFTYKIRGNEQGGERFFKEKVKEAVNKVYNEKLIKEEVEKKLIAKENEENIPVNNKKKKKKNKQSFPEQQIPSRNEIEEQVKKDFKQRSAMDDFSDEVYQGIASKVHQKIIERFPNTVLPEVIEKIKSTPNFNCRITDEDRSDPNGLTVGGMMWYKNALQLFLNEDYNKKRLEAAVAAETARLLSDPKYRRIFQIKKDHIPVDLMRDNPKEYQQRAKTVGKDFVAFITQMQIGNLEVVNQIDNGTFDYIIRGKESDSLLQFKKKIQDKVNKLYNQELINSKIELEVELEETAKNEQELLKMLDQEKKQPPNLKKKTTKKPPQEKDSSFILDEKRRKEIEKGVQVSLRKEIEEQVRKNHVFKKLEEDDATAFNLEANPIARRMLNDVENLDIVGTLPPSTQKFMIDYLNDESSKLDFRFKDTGNDCGQILDLKKSIHQEVNTKYNQKLIQLEIESRFESALQSSSYHERLQSAITEAIKAEENANNALELLLKEEDASKGNKSNKAKKSSSKK